MLEFKTQWLFLGYSELEWFEPGAMPTVAEGLMKFFLIINMGVIALAIGAAQASGKYKAERQPIVVTKPIDSSSSRSIKKKQPPPTKTPNPGGPVPIPYPN